ncbi:MAG: hypothetical protein ABJP44_11350 [Sulfitobacter sp.]|uniref:hypothetical protein n=1 Tax=Sulfitobacter sp. TaxID=1903071 RepID=UPI003297A15E
MYKLNRFEWLKAVLQCADLNSSTKVVAAALAVQFANDKTGQLNPSLKTLDTYLASVSLATIKRCLRHLDEAGWLFRTEGRGAGNCTQYELRAPCQIVPFRAKKKGASMRFQGEKKGSTLNEKGVTYETSYITDKRSEELMPSTEKTYSDGQVPHIKSVDCSLGVFVSRQSFGCRQWETFIEKMFNTRIEHILPECVENGEYGYWLPSKFPPTDHSAWPAVRRKLVAAERHRQNRQ